MAHQTPGVLIGARVAKDLETFFLLTRLAPMTISHDAGDAGFSKRSL